MAPTKQGLIDLGWRGLWTALQAFIAVLLGASAGMIDANVLQAAGVAALGAGLSVVKSYAGQKLSADAPLIGR